VQDEEKLKERISLLTRFFWLEDLFKIGRELDLDCFKRYTNYWEINQYHAATEIARNIDDNKLVELTRRHLPKYGLMLGGFHGNYYTASDTGELKLESSWNLIRKNAQKALDKWGDRAYGTLQALINKNGRATYFDLIDEIEKVLGYEFIPSYFLPRLGPLNLVFKTGSNKYPDWTMPSEIIPAVQEELRNFKRPIRPHLIRFTPSERLLRLEREIGLLVDKIAQARRNLNLLFERKFGTALLQQKEMAINDIRKPCSNEEEFTNRIMSLALLISEIETAKITRLIKSEKAETGSINLIETLLDEVAPNFDKSIIKNLRMIMALRSKKYPVHKDDPTLLNSLSYFGFTTMPPDWQDLWENVLQRYLDSLEGLISIIVSMG
jgi:hypothetical protein